MHNKKVKCIIFSIIVLIVILLIVIIGKDNGGKTITREYALYHITRAIGINDEIENQYEGVYFTEKTIYDINSAQVSQGFLHIVIGELRILDIDKGNIRLNDQITLKECLNMIVGCLEDGNRYTGIIDENCAKELAYKYGIIKFYDMFAYKSDNDYITDKNLNTMITRLKKQKRYKYYKYSNDDMMWELCKDEYRQITYEEYLNKKEEELMIIGGEDIGDGVSRKEATKMIMSAIGCDDKVACSILYMADGPEISKDLFIPVITEDNLVYGYLHAAAYNGFIKADEKKMLYPEKNMTLKEALNMIAMCLQDDWLDYENSYRLALKKGIVNKSDAFYLKAGDSYISKNDLCIIIDRLKKQKRYKYFGDNEDFIVLVSTDKYGTITYEDFLNNY